MFGALNLVKCFRLCLELYITSVRVEYLVPSTRSAAHETDLLFHDYKYSTFDSLGSARYDAGLQCSQGNVMQRYIEMKIPQG
jgi:hypothetical protein